MNGSSRHIGKKQKNRINTPSIKHTKSNIKMILVSQEVEEDGKDPPTEPDKKPTTARLTGSKEEEEEEEDQLPQGHSSHAGRIPVTIIRCKGVGQDSAEPQELAMDQSRAVNTLSTTVKYKKTWTVIDPNDSNIAFGCRQGQAYEKWTLPELAVQARDRLFSSAHVTVCHCGYYSKTP